MENQKYKVFFNGSIVEGQKAESVKKNLAVLFKTDSEKLEKYFTGESLIIKSDLDYQTAAKIQEAFQKKGAVCIIEPLEQKELVIVSQKNDVNPEPQNPQPENDVIEAQVSEPLTLQLVILNFIAILVRTIWSLTIGLPFFIIGLILFLIIDISAPRSDISYRVLTNMYKWGSCHWFKRLKLETEHFDVDVKKKRK